MLETQRNPHTQTERLRGTETETGRQTERPTDRQTKVCHGTYFVLQNYVIYTAKHTERHRQPSTGVLWY